MPTVRPCRRCGRTIPATGRRYLCPRCQVAADRQRTACRGTTTARGYDAEYKHNAATVRQYARDHDSPCALCGQPLDPTRISVDHIVALADGGSSDLENLRPVHPRCNSRRGAGRKRGCEVGPA